MLRKCLLGVSFLALGCGDEAFLSEIVGPEGGVLSGGGVVMAVPGGALNEEVEISMYVEQTPPAGFTDVVGLVYRLEPSGLTFDEPALINLEAPPDFFGRLYLSRPDGTGFDPIGFVEYGKARAFVPHFSTLVMSGMGCRDTAVDNNQSCECYDGTPPSFEDGVGALCPTNPGMDECGFDTTDRCRDYRNNEDGTPAFVGREGADCSGQARRPELRNRCYCVGFSGPATGLSLCRNMFDFTGGMMLCPCGIWDFDGRDGTRTNGYYVVDSGPPDYTRSNEGAECQMNECFELQPWAGRYEGIAGHMTNCVPQGPPAGAPDYPPWMPEGSYPPMGPPPELEAPAMMPSADCPAM